MRGEILSFDPTTGTGQISGDDGIRYGFSSAAIQPPTSVTSGLRVDFVPVAGEATQVVVMVSAPTANAFSTSAHMGATNASKAGDFDFQKTLFSFQGRTRRSHFWLAWLILLGAGFVVNFIPFIGFLIAIAAIWPQTAIQVTRLHDMGKSGWWALLPFLVSVGGMIGIISTVGMSYFMNARALENEDPAAIMALIGPALGIGAVMVVVGLGFLLWIGISDSQSGENRFGPNPKGL